MRAFYKSLAMVPIVALLVACVPAGGGGSSDVEGLERVTGDDIDGDCQTPGPSQASGNESFC